MNVEIINTGSELMLGRVLNTHQQWLCRELADCGYPVRRQVAVADAAGEIQQAVREAIGRAQVIIVTGGLGPTSDDLTRAAIAELLGRPLRMDPGIEARLEAWFASRGRVMSPDARVQAQVPEGAVVLPNAHGTAPGLVLSFSRGSTDADAGLLIMLPGPPRELRPMFTSQALPIVRQQFPIAGGLFCRTLRTTGIGESLTQERIEAPLEPLIRAGLEVGYCARPGEVDVRLAAAGPEGLRIVGEAEKIVRGLLGAHLFGAEEDTLESVVVGRLTELGRTVVVAESCTGGHLADRITNVPGASAVFLGGLITYSNELKERLLGVLPATLAAHGAVSEATAREMAEGARQRQRADYALAITGIAGPTGGTPDKAVGTVFIAMATAARTTVVERLNRFDRETFKHVTSQQALDLLRVELASP